MNVILKVEQDNKPLNIFRIVLLIGLEMSFFFGHPQNEQKIIVLPFPDKVIGDEGGLRAGDFNNDGYEDIVVIAPLYRNAENALTGCLLIYPGSKTGLDKIPEVLIEGSFPGTIRGIASCTTGDFNGDGYDDLVLGNNLYGEPQLDQGYVQLHFGSSGGIRKRPDIVMKGATRYGSYGSNLMTVDYNGDGRDDLLVEARFDKLLEGRIYIYTGKKNFFLGRPEYSLSRPGSESLYLGATGDVNNDGYSDLICRSNLNWNVYQHEIIFFYGGPSADHTPDRIIPTTTFSPVLFLPQPDGGKFYLIGSVRLKDQSDVTQIALADLRNFTLLNQLIPGSARKISAREQKNDFFFVMPSSSPDSLYRYAIDKSTSVPVLLKKIPLPGEEISQVNGLITADTDGNGHEEIILAITDKNREKLVVFRQPFTADP